MNGRAKAAQVYPPELCRAICKGFLNQARKDQKFMKHIGNLGKMVDAKALQAKQKQVLQVAAEIESMFGGPKDHEGLGQLNEALGAPEDEDKWMEAWDDVKGKELDVGKVKKARKKTWSTSRRASYTTKCRDGNATRRLGRRPSSLSG